MIECKKLEEELQNTNKQIKGKKQKKKKSRRLFYNLLDSCTPECKVPPIKNWRKYLKQAKYELENKVWKLPLNVKLEEICFLKYIKIPFGVKLLSLRKISIGRFDYMKIYMIKAFKKKKIMENSLENYLKTEKEILSQHRFPFIQHMEFFFQNNYFIYFGFPIKTGHSLRFYLEVHGVLNEAYLHFYTPQIILALEYLHYMGIIFRNLLPNYIMVNPNGYLKLTGFFKAKYVTNKTYTLCFNLLYAAPEALSGHGYNKSVDWWALGVTIIELGVGYTPFNAGSYSDTLNRIKNGIFKLPGNFSNNLKNLLSRLLITETDFRICAESVNDIKNHRWFTNLAWDKMLSQTLRPLYIPSFRLPTQNMKLVRNPLKYLICDNNGVDQTCFQDF